MKHISITLYDIPMADFSGNTKSLGSMMFGETFLDSRISVAGTYVTFGIVDSFRAVLSTCLYSFLTFKHHLVHFWHQLLWGKKKKKLQWVTTVACTKKSSLWNHHLFQYIFFSTSSHDTRSLEEPYGFYVCKIFYLLSYILV